MKLRSVTVSVPASTSNLGSGFDTLGLAVRLYNVITVRTVKGPGIVLPEEARKMVQDAAESFFKTTNCPQIGFEVSSKNEIPIARGLGFSSTVRVGVLAGLDTLCGTRLSSSQLLQIATGLEGHPDNASPALFGGFTVSARTGGEVRCLRFQVSASVRLVTAIPKFAIETEKARSLVPKEFSKQDAAHALNRAAMITAAFAAQDYVALNGLFDDRFHQPYREKLVPELGRVVKAAEDAGAIGGWLSGSGSGIMCLTLKNTERVARAMKAAMPDSEILILKPENRGYRMHK